jgi:hypothetical protein
MIKNFAKISFALCVLTTITPSAGQVSDSEFAKYAALEANRSGFAHKRLTKIIINGKDDWEISTKHPIYIYLDDHTLQLSDAKFKDDATKRTKEITFITNSTSVYGVAKVTFCNSKVCTKPISTNFNITDK